MKVSEIRRQFLRLAYERDDRKSPDNLRRGQFRAGWFGTVSEETLKQKLTWRNLGCRMGQHFGPQSDEQINKVFQALADDYLSGAVQPAKKAVLKRSRRFCGVKSPAEPHRDTSGRQAQAPPQPRLDSLGRVTPARRSRIVSSLWYCPNEYSIQSLGPYSVS